MKKTLCLFATLVIFAAAALGQQTANGRYYWIQGGETTQTASYTVQPSDNGKMIVMNCTAACTLTLNGSPFNGLSFGIVSINTTYVATVSLNSKNFNGSSTVPVLISYMPLFFWSDGTNYFGNAPLVAGSGTSFTTNPYGLTIVNSASTPQVNGSNISATPLNLQNSTDIVVANPSSGNVTITFTPIVNTVTATQTGSLSSTTLTTTGASATFDHFDWAVSLASAGVACTGSTTVAVNLIFTDPNAASSVTEVLGTVTVAANGNGTLGFIAEGADSVWSKASTAVSLSTTYTEGSGCSTAPGYTVSYKLF